MKEVSTIGIDLAKNRFRVVGTNKAGKVVFRKWLNRREVLCYMANFTPCLVGMEACAGSYYWAREFQKLGHEVKLMPPQYVKPYVKTNKNDTNDAEACAEAVTRPTMRFVSIKSERQQELGQLHRVRERLIRARTAVGNEIRGFLGEFGIVFPKGITKLSRMVHKEMEEHQEHLSTQTVELLKRLCQELNSISEEIDWYEGKILQEHRSLPESVRLDSIRGVGEITATAIVSRHGGVAQFRNGRQFVAFIGLVPRQNSTGGRSKLGGISKCGDVYLRKLLIQGAQSVLKNAKNKTDRYSLWVQALCERRGWCRAAVAIANKNARIAWAILAHGTSFNAEYVPVKTAA